MALRSKLTDLLGLEYPIVLAPMASVSGGKLAAAVSNAGGLGLVGGGYGDPDWMRRELHICSEKTDKPWGLGLITWAAAPEAVELALSYEPNAFMLSFGDPRPYARTIIAAGCTFICQVQDVEGALLAQDAGADIIVAQGTEAGGHGAVRSTLPLVPAVVDAVQPIPVLAAGGIADGRGLAAAFMLGAQGVLMGTRFYAATEALGHQKAKAEIVEARGGETHRTRVFDLVRGRDWREPYTGRALRNQFGERWDKREEELRSKLDEEARRFGMAQDSGDFETAMIWAGEAVDLISDVLPAADIVRHIGAEAERCLTRGRGQTN